MNIAARKTQRVYLTLLLCNTLAASLIWGINTLFLLDAGLSNTEAFAANAFFTLGMLLFEVPTGVVADWWGRRTSYLLGTITLASSTILYLLMWHLAAPFWGWAMASILLGLGFTFFSGAVEAWLVDALTHNKYKGKLDDVFAKGEIVEGVAMLGGSIAGGLIAQATNLGIPYILRAVILAATFVLAFILMKDIGFTPARGKNAGKEIKLILVHSVEQGLRRPAVRWVMLASPFIMGVSVYAFYAMQPYLLELYGDEHAYGIAGLAAAIVAGAQIVGGLMVPYIGRLFRKRTTVLIVGTILSTGALLIAGLVPNFWLAIAMLVVWALVFAAIMPVRHAYLNRLIPSDQRATVLSFDSLFGSGGGVIAQPLLGRAADIWSYSTSYIIGAGLQAMAIPFLWLAQNTKPTSDLIEAKHTAGHPLKRGTLPRLHFHDDKHKLRRKSHQTTE